LTADLEAALGTALERGTVSDVAVAQSDAQADALWALRENIAEAQKLDGPNIKHDISLPVSAIPRFLDETGRALVKALPGLRFVTFGHLGDGNLHYNLASPAGVEPETFLASTPVANRIVHDLVAAHHGSISAEHGIGQQKRDELVRYKSAVELDLMRALKATFDPHAVLNPGKVL
jgi:FAD/FMN-containing dehydrogenase